MQPYWIWYPGDFSLYHALKQNFSRVERGFGWPAFWRSEPFRQRVAFRCTYQLSAPTTFTVYTDAVGYVMVQEEKYPFGVEIPCPAGEVSISIHAGRIDAFPAVYIEGEVVASDEGWMVEDYADPPVPAGHSKLYTRRDQDPTVPESRAARCTALPRSSPPFWRSMPHRSSFRAAPCTAGRPGRRPWPARTAITSGSRTGMGAVPGAPCATSFSQALPFP